MPGRKRIHATAPARVAKAWPWPGGAEPGCAARSVLRSPYQSRSDRIALAEAAARGEEAARDRLPPTGNDRAGGRHARLAARVPQGGKAQRRCARPPLSRKRKAKEGPCSLCAIPARPSTTPRL